MNDKELLQAAARAAGIEYGADRTDCGVSITGKDGRHIHFPKWNPLRDPGDALRLAVALKIDYLLQLQCNGDLYQQYQSDPLAATMRAITRAAAEIGREKI